MNLDKYEKIDGREALKRLLASEIVLDGLADEHFLDGTILARIRKSGAYETVNDGLKQILETTWYIPKPFDVRQAMLERPNEWVGAYNDGVGWWAVGFDLNHYCVVSKQMPISYPVDAEYAGADFPKPDQLNICIPIEDVPKEATR